MPDAFAPAQAQNNSGIMNNTKYVWSSGTSLPALQTNIPEKAAEIFIYWFTKALTLHRCLFKGIKLLEHIFSHN